MTCGDRKKDIDSTPIAMIPSGSGVNFLTVRSQSVGEPFTFARMHR